ncbi:MAG TPA: lytic transglycosylase domain-containing protein [Pseudonocardiaceae bacterium]|nr:lytic transglycosylase domain-containing protein [Pseudonocardiaceae bacterium]
MPGPPSTSTSEQTPPFGNVVPRRRRRWPVLVAVAAPLVVLAVLVTVWLSSGPLSTVTGPPPPEAPLFTIPELDVTPGSEVPMVPRALPATAATRDRWLTDMSANSDIPRRVLLAYVDAARTTAQRHPSCRLTWTTLAGIGRIESDHGQHHGDLVTSSGTELYPIVGPVLDGSPGVRSIHDTDHGRLDGDRVWDHAVGPMQFLPSRWASMGERASGDGKAPDPQNIDDAALTAATYLCESGDLAVPARWWRAAFHYNNSVSYGRAVFSAAEAYAKVGAKVR